MKRVTESLIVVLLVCLGVRLAWLLVSPVLPAVGMLVMLGVVGWWLLLRRS